MIKYKFCSPMLLALACFLAGIYFQSIIEIPMPQLLYGMSITSILICTLLLFKKILPAKIISLPLFLCFGYSIITLQKAAHSTALNDLPKQEFNVYGTIMDKGLWGERLDKHWMRITVYEVFVPSINNHLHIAFDLLCYVNHKTQFCVDDIIEIKHICIKPMNKQCDGNNASYQDYLMKEGILNSVFLTYSNTCTIIQHPSVSIRRRFWNVRNNIYHTIQKKVSPLAFTYIGLMFFGNKEHLNLQQLRTTFNQWGLAHYLARSGLHIVLFIVIWMFLLSFIPLHITIKRVLLVFICLIYDLFSWTSISFARAFYVFLLMKGGQFVQLQTNFLYILSLVCFGLLLINPIQLFFLDFQLSFALTFTLTLFSSFLDNRKST